MSVLKDAACVGMHWLFDSTDPADHLEARKICQTCPVLDACDKLRQQVEADTRGISGQGGGPVGTWAGRLLAPKGSRKPSGKPGRQALPREHGTRRGYDQHRYRRETPCDMCRKVAA